MIQLLFISAITITGMMRTYNHGAGQFKVTSSGSHPNLKIQNVEGPTLEASIDQGMF